MPKETKGPNQWYVPEVTVGKPDIKDVQEWLRKRTNAAGQPLTDQFEEPVYLGNNWWRFPSKTFREEYLPTVTVGPLPLEYDGYAATIPSGLER